VIEPYALPASPYDAFASGHYNDVPTLIGFNAEEARSFVDVRKEKAATFAADLPGFFPPQLKSPEFLAAFPHATDAQAQGSRIQLETELRFGWSMWAWARLQAAPGRAPVYFYRFDHRPPFPPTSPYAGWGAAHLAELWYVFDHLDQQAWSWRPADRRLADQMARYWTNFARKGDPNGPGLPPWPRYAGADAEVLHLDDVVAAGPLPVTAGLTAIDHLYSLARGAPFGSTPP
jgi:para-nitrobenzyl esterase